MRSVVFSVVLAVLSIEVLSAPQDPVITPAPSPAPACTITVLKEPSFNRICTNYGKTLTYTSYTECGGCTLVTKRLGLGLPCRTVTYNPGNTGTIVTSCRPPRATTTKTITQKVRPTVTLSL